MVSPGGIVTNEEIRKRTGQTLLEKVIRERLRWLGHVKRMDEVRIPKQGLQREVTGFKRRPRINWRDIVNKGLQSDVHVLVLRWATWNFDEQADIR